MTHRDHKGESLATGDRVVDFDACDENGRFKRGTVIGFTTDSVVCAIVRWDASSSAVERETHVEPGDLTKQWAA